MSCSCDVSLSNTGTPNCVPIASVIKKLVLVSLVADDGTSNFIDTTDTLDEAYFLAKINHADPSKRWYVTPEIKNVTSEKADSVFEEFDDASKIFIRQGKRSFTGIMPKQTPTLLGQLENWRCAEFGVYAIDKDGNLIGVQSVADTLYPITIDAPSWNPTLLFGTDSVVQKIQLTFDFSLNVNDSTLQMITASEVAPVNLISLEGLLDVNSTYSSISTTSFKAALSILYGTAITKQPVKGLVAGDFALYNVDDAASVTILTAVESPSGTYTFTYAAQGSGENLRLTPTKNGYDFSNVVASLISIP
jgi:hypothetical protein